MVGTLALSSLTGCGKDNTTEEGKVVLSSEGGYTVEEAASTKVMKVGEYDVYLNEAMVYTLQEMYMQGATSATMTEEKITEYKNKVLDTIRQVKIINDVAINNDYVLPEEEKSKIDEAVANSKTLFGQEILDKYGITDEVLYMVYTEQFTVEMFSAYIKEDMGDSIYADLVKAYEEIQFVGVYVMRFPIVQKTDTDEPMRDEAGQYVYISDSDKETVYAQAEQAKKDIEAGEDVASVAEKNGVIAYSQASTGYIGGFSEELNSQLENMEIGDCTEIYEDELCYGIIILQSIDDGTDKEAYLQVQTTSTLSTQFETLQTRWLQTIAIDTVNDLEGTVWTDFDLLNFVKDMEIVINK